MGFNVLIDNERDEQEIWLRYKKNKDKKLKDYLIRKYTPLIKYVAGKMSIGMSGSVDFDDLVGFGAFGLLDAVEKFDPDKNVKFKTYAVTRIKGAIYDELRCLDWVPRSVRQKAREVEEVIRSVEGSLGRAATDAELAVRMNMPVEEFQKTLQKISCTSILSLNEMWTSSDDNDKVSMMDSIESPPSLNPEMIAEREEMKKIIANAISELPEKEKKVLVLYYFEDLTLKEIGQVLEVTESRISQLHAKAILRLRSKLTSIKKGIL